ncbi:Uma2 family endonuclease [Leptothoe kymatousa]|uniref:Uma2 family endonuclease n=1 Tax=Leptothoe kymatousa TAU-MAC 1615 TaxID=2364775 RepID=A0ABS5Y661_9CYAN|nr:Uma2 family endonuclease [Leptothoe kymatousa]MBT9312839.1 Uma2 family endonuclease [Leptothoe kymatousa TAU-MAC 1615]
MTSMQVKSDLTPLTVDLSSLMSQARMTEEQFYAFCQSNRDLRIERTAAGKVIVMPPAFSDTGNRNLKIAQQVANWSDQNGTGEVFDSSSGFTLPNGATRSPDVAWVKLARWNALSKEQQASFAPICPDFIVELRSASDAVKTLQEKMEEYVDNGAELGLLIDRKNRNVHVYRPGQPPEILTNPDSVSCDPELSGFSLQMARVW